MFTLRLLGGLRLENGSDDPTGRATQRRRLALLAVLALSPGRRSTRDRLLAILWPEGTEEEGRRRLSTALYDTRRLLGEKAIGNQGDAVWLDPAAVTVDVDQFLEAVQHERWQEAERHYRGPLLDGVHLPDSVEFEEWLAGHRERLQRTYFGVLERLALALAGAGDWSAAAERWSRLAGLEPLSGRWTCELMKAQAALGDRAGALRVGDRFAARLREEMGIVDEAVERLTRELRAPRPSVRPEVVKPAEPAVPDSWPEPAVSREPASSLAPAAQSVKARSPRLRWLVLAAALLVAGFLATRRDTSSPPPGPDSTVRVAVLPFRVTGDSSLAFLEDGLVDLLSADLESVGAFAVVDPHALIALVRDVRREGKRLEPRVVAGRTGATRYIAGTVFGFGDSVRITATLREAGSGRLIRESRVSGLRSAIPSLVDAITAEFAAGELGTPAGRIASVAAGTTLSIPALREFLVGEDHFRHGRFGPAVAAYRRAVGKDTSFALAHYRLSLAILWGNRPGASTDVHDSLAREHAGRLSPRDRALVEAYLAWRGGRAEEAWRRYEEIVQRHPDDVEATYQFGETIFHYSPLLGRSISHARPTFERVVALDPAHWGARWHLALLDASEGRVSDMRDQVVRLLALEPDSISALEIQLASGVGTSGGSAPPAEQADELVLFGAAWRRAVFVRDLDGAARLLEVLNAPSRSPYSRVLANTALDQLSLAQGRWHPAGSHWRMPGNFGLPVGLPHRILAAVTPGFERSRPGRDSLEQDLAAWRRSVGSKPTQYFRLDPMTRGLDGLLKAARGDAEGARAVAEVLDTLSVAAEDVEFIRTRARTIRASLAYREGRDREALDLLVGRKPNAWYGVAVTSVDHSRPFERFMEAQLLDRLGRPLEAVGLFESFAEHALHDLVYLVPALLRAAEINERLGRSERATEQYGKAAALWRTADPENAAMLQRHIRAIQP